MAKLLIEVDIWGRAKTCERKDGGLCQAAEYDCGRVWCHLFRTWLDTKEWLRIPECLAAEHAAKEQGGGGLRVKRGPVFSHGECDGPDEKEGGK